MPFEADIQKVKTFFNCLYDKHGESERALAYGSKKSQELRFEILTQLASLDGASILDVGCGFADLYDFLVAKGVRVSYTGCELAPKIAAVAQARHPDLEVLVGNVLEWRGDERFDYVLGTGFNCVFTGNNDAMIRAIVKKMYALCRRGVSVGMVSDYQPSKHADTFYANPEALFSFCMSLCGCVTLRHDYLVHDFTMYLYKAPQQRGG